METYNSESGGDQENYDTSSNTTRVFCHIFPVTKPTRHFLVHTFTEDLVCSPGQHTHAIVVEANPGFVLGNTVS